MIVPVASYLITYSVDKINLPGKAEPFFIIIDLANVGFSQMPLTALKRFLGVV